VPGSLHGLASPVIRLWNPLVRFEEDGLRHHQASDGVFDVAIGYVPMAKAFDPDSHRSEIRRAVLFRKGLPSQRKRENRTAGKDAKPGDRVVGFLQFEEEGLAWRNCPKRAASGRLTKIHFVDVGQRTKERVPIVIRVGDVAADCFTLQTSKLLRAG